MAASTWTSIIRATAIYSRPSAQVVAYVGEVEIAGDQGETLAQRVLRDLRILCPTQTDVANVDRFVPMLTHDLGNSARQVRIQQKPHRQAELPGSG